MKPNLRKALLRSTAGAAGFSLLLGALAASLPAVAQDYRVVDLGMDDAVSEAAAVNNAGSAAGWFQRQNRVRRAFLYQDGEVLEIGGAAGAATALNGVHQVAGYLAVESGQEAEPVRQAFLWEDGELRMLGALYCPCDFNRRYGISEAYGINDGGQVVGSSETVRGSWVRHAFLWNGTQLLDIGGGAGDWSISQALDINNAGRVVGWIAEDAGLRDPPEDFERRAFLWEAGQRQDIGALPGDESSAALAVNERGQVAGWSGSVAAGSYRAAFWSGDGITGLGTLDGDDNSMALGINDNGQVVGWSGAAREDARSAFLWQSGQMLDLNALLPPGSNWRLLEARAIDNNGRIVGVGIRNGERRAFLLEPGG